MAERPVGPIRQRSLWPKVAIVVLVLLLLCYALGGFFLLPWWLQKNLPDQAQQQFGWQASVGEIHTNPFSFSAELNNLQATDAGGETVLSIRRLYLNLDAFELFTGTAGVQTVELEQPLLRLDVLADGQLNLSRDWHQAPARAGQAASRDESTQSDLKAYLQLFELQNGTLVLRDFSQSEKVEFRITPLTFRLQNLATWARPGDVGQYSLQAMLDEQILSWQGSFEVDPIYSRGSLSIDNLGPGVLSYALAPYIPYQLRSGRLSLSTDYQWQAGQPMELLIQHGQLKFEDIALALGPEAEELAFRSGALTVDKVYFDLAAGRVDLGTIELDGPQLGLSRNASGDIDWLLAGASSATDGVPSSSARATDASASNTALGWSVAGVRVRDGQLSWRDQVPANAAELQLNALNFSIEQFSDHLDDPVNYQAQAVLASGGTVDLNGQFTLRPFNLEMAIAGNKLSLPGFAPYLQQQIALELSAGLLSVDGNLDLDQQRKPLTGTFSGSASVTDLETRLPGSNQPLLAWQMLQLAPIEYNVNPARLEIGRITLADMVANIVRNDDGSHDISNLATNAANAEPSANRESLANREPSANRKSSANEKPGFIFRIGELQLNNADVHYTDRTLKPELTTHFGQLQGSLSGLSNIPPQQGKARLSGQVNQVGSLDLSGSIATLGTDQQSAIELNLKNLELPRLSPYSGRFLGYRIAGGKMDLHLDYQLQGTRINADNHIVLNRLELGQAVASSQAVNAPIKLGLALLRDGENVIELDVPVEGDMADPEFQMGRVIMRAFVNILVKAASSPLTLLGSLADMAGLGGEQLDQVSFAPASTELTDASTEKLAALAQALNQKPELILSIRGAVAPEADASTDAGTPKALANSRAAAMRQLLVGTHSVDPEQIFVRAPETDASLDANGNIAVNFSLDAR